MGLIRTLTWPIRTGMKIGAIALALGMAYNAGYRKTADWAYEIRRVEHVAYLHDKQSGRSYQIHEGAYVGDAEHMIKGAAHLKYESAKSALEEIIGDHETRH